MASGQNSTLELVIVNALRIPGVKVDRTEFLTKTFSNYAEPSRLGKIIELGPVNAGIDVKTINSEAKALIDKRTLQSSGVSFAAGLPGGFAMAASIPADTMQFFGTALRIAQELAYLYGFKDLWENGAIDDKAVRNELIIFIGVMFGVSGSAAALRVISANMSKQILKKLPQKTLTKTVSYPIIKKIAALLGVKLTKDTFAKGLSKAIPIIGGVVSAGMTYASMKPMGERLRKTLIESVSSYSQSDYNRDLGEVGVDLDNYIDVEYEEASEQKEARTNITSMADEIMKLKQLLDLGAITSEEFEKLKANLLNSRL
ncbi:SHOCT domain-containing protein [Clostridium swellfunianum]|uniref:SHOCT domain-containing protein n=1 Tax=Clostridium swellfunianum TaxID=1367462 RepID=UPI00202E2B94|nr:SHOCT domain-containing protein [Clostridium swellfunianum]MCM0647198.1 SHOCT domain-containing protein [Clostridium swellfunianum]